MKPHSPHDFSSDPDTALDEFFRVREMATDEFAQRTLAAARKRRRRAQVVQLTAWASGVAACLALAFGLTLSRTATDEPAMAVAQEESDPAKMAPEPPKPPELTATLNALLATPPPAPSTAEELTAELDAALARDNTVLYGQARELEDLLAEAQVLYEEEDRATLDFLILLAEN